MVLSSQVDEQTRELMFRLRQTWNEILPKKLLFALDSTVHEIDAAWPINGTTGGTRTPVDRNAQQVQRPVVDSDTEKRERLKEEIRAKKKLLVDARIEKCKEELKGVSYSILNRPQIRGAGKQS